jgi:hypothetical protein
VLLPASLIVDDAGDDLDGGEEGRALAAIGAGPRPAPRHLADGTAEIPPTPSVRRHRRSSRPADPAPSTPRAGDGSTADTEPLPIRRPEPTVFTPSGLPFRSRDGDRPDAAPVPEPNGAIDADTDGKGQREVRSMMTSYRAGTLRGRDDAARLTEGSPPPPELIIPKQDSHGTDEGR